MNVQNHSRPEGFEVADHIGEIVITHSNCRAFLEFRRLTPYVPPDNSVIQNGIVHHHAVHIC